MRTPKKYALFALLVPIRPGASGRDRNRRFLPAQCRGAIRPDAIRIAAANQERSLYICSVGLFDIDHTRYGRRGESATAAANQSIYTGTRIEAVTLCHSPR